MQKGLRIYPSTRFLNWLGTMRVSIDRQTDHQKRNAGPIIWAGMRKQLFTNEKISFLMKCSFILLIVQFTCIGMLLANTVHSQDLNQKISLTLENATLKESLLKIEKQSNIQFVLPEKLVGQIQKKSSLNMQNVTIKQAIEKVLHATGLKFEVVENYIVIAAIPAPGFREGFIYDAKTKETLIGAVVVINGRSYPTDANGHYKITLQPGSYDLEIRYIGYDAKKTPGIVVKEKVTTTLNVLLQPNTTTLGTVTIEVRRRANTEASILNDRKRAAALSDGISAQNIEKTASITTAQALQRVTGVTITDDK